MVPYDHALLSTHRWGGRPEDYMNIHNFLDCTKGHYCKPAHRLILHNAFGMLLCEEMFGSVIQNSDGNEIAVREIARMHIVEDLGRVPTLQDWLENVDVQPWMLGISGKHAEILKTIKSQPDKTDKTDEAKQTNSKDLDCPE